MFSGLSKNVQLHTALTQAAKPETEISIYRIQNRNIVQGVILNVSLNRKMVKMSQK